MRLIVRELALQSIVNSLNIILDGHVDTLRVIVTRDDVEEALVGISVATEEENFLTELGHTRILVNTELGLASGLVNLSLSKVLDDAGVQTTDTLALGLAARGTFLTVVLAEIEERYTLVREREVLLAVDVLPQRLTGSRVVQVQSTLVGPTSDRELTNVDTGLVGIDFVAIIGITHPIGHGINLIASGSGSVLDVVDSNLYLSKSVLQVEHQTVL